jgi:hypothetical protein
VNGIDPSGNMTVGVAIGIGIGAAIGSMVAGASLNIIFGKASILGAFGAGLLQGWANIINGVQDIAVGLLNLFIFSQNMQWKYMSGGLIPFNIPTVTSSDWSRGLFTEEDKDFLGMGKYWGDSHGWSKFIGGESFVTLASLGTTYALSSIGQEGALIAETSSRHLALHPLKLTARQSQLLARLPKSDSYIKVHKHAVNMKDLRNLTAHTGDEFLILTRGHQRVIIRGQGAEISVMNRTVAEGFARKGWKLSGHTHRISGRDASPNDFKALKIFEQYGQKNSGIWGPNWGYGGYPMYPTQTIVFK